MKNLKGIEVGDSKKQDEDREGIELRGRLDVRSERRGGV
jgi:hypothetical protein